MANLDRPPSGAPPSYEQSLTHQRIEGTRYPDHPYPTDGAYPGPPRIQPPRPSRPGRNRFQLPSTDLSGSVSPTVVREDDVISTATSTDEETKACIKLVLPPMHMCIAVTCLVFNILIPGTGTMLSGWGIFCCTRKDKWLCREKCLGCVLNIAIGIAQLALVPVILIGWIWSVIWGFALLGVSLDDYHGMKDSDDEASSSHDPERASRPISARLFPRNIRIPTRQTSVVHSTETTHSTETAQSDVNRSSDSISSVTTIDQESHGRSRSSSEGSTSTATSDDESQPDRMTSSANHVRRVQFNNAPRGDSSLTDVAT